MLILGDVLRRHGISQAALASGLKWSTAAVSGLIRHHRYPRTIKPREVRALVSAVLTQLEVPVDELVDLFLESDAPDGVAAVTAPRISAAPSGTTSQPREVESEMLLRKQTLSEAARRKFSIFRDPFDDPQQASEVYLSRAIRQVREAMWQVALGNTKFLAVIGESGAGKSTLREELEERLRVEARAGAADRPLRAGDGRQRQEGQDVEERPHCRSDAARGGERGVPEAFARGAVSPGA